MKIILSSILPITTALICIIALPSCSKDGKKERAFGSATEFFEKGDYAAAEIELKNALKADPGNPEAVKYLGLIRENQGASYEAAGMLAYAKEKLPEDDLVRVNLAQSMLALGFVQDARKELLAILDRSPSDGEALVLLAESSLTPEWMEECEQRIAKSGEKNTSNRLASALLALRRGEMEKGEAAVEELLAIDPKSARAHALKSSILNSKKQPEAALAALRTSADLAGARSNESMAYARMLMSLGRRDEALAYVEKITTETPDFLAAWAILGQIAYSEKNDEVATKHFMNVLSKNPVDMNSAMMQAEIFIRSKKPDQAVEILEKVSTAFPSRPQIEYALAKAYIAADKINKAALALDRALSAAPDFNDAAALRAQLHLQEGKTAEALILLESVRQKSPKDTVSRDLLIRAYRNAGRNDEAITLLREKAADDDKNPNAQVELGQLLGAQGKLDEARSIFEGALETFSGSLAAVSNLASIDLREGKGQASLKRIEDFIVSHPDSSEAYTVKAKIALHLEQPKIAEESLKKAIELKADNAQAYALLLQMKNDAGQETEALTTLDGYLKAFPNDSQAALQRGYLLQEMGRLEDALAAFSSLIESKPDFAPAYNNLATLEAESFNRLEVAVNHARKARELDHTQPAIADTLGWIEWRLGNFSAALPLLKEAAEKLSDNPEVLYHYAMARYSMGQAAEAKAGFKAALTASADFPQKLETEKHLNLLEKIDTTTIADLEILEKRITEHPKDVIAHLRLAELLANNERTQEALEAYQAAFTANPSIPAALVGQARLYAGPLNAPAKALEVATAARELAPREPLVLAALGSAKLLAGAHDEAYGLLKDAAAILESDARVVYDYARAAYSLGRVEEARTAMSQVATTDDPIAGDAKRFLLLTDSEALKQPGIHEEVEKSLVKNPQDVAALMLRGSLQTAAGTNPESTYLEILRHHPRFDPARVRLAGIYVEDPAKLDQALSLASEARARMSDDPELMRIFAIGNYRKGDYPYAAQLMSEISTKRSLVPDELFILGMSLANSKQPGKAREILEQAVSTGLSEPAATQAKEALAKLEESQEKK